MEAVKLVHFISCNNCKKQLRNGNTTLARPWVKEQPEIKVASGTASSRTPLQLQSGTVECVQRARGCNWNVHVLPTDARMSLTTCPSYPIHIRFPLEIKLKKRTKRPKKKKKFQLSYELLIQSKFISSFYFKLSLFFQKLEKFTILIYIYIDHSSKI